MEDQILKTDVLATTLKFDPQHAIPADLAARVAAHNAGSTNRILG